MAEQHSENNEQRSAGNGEARGNRSSQGGRSGGYRGNSGDRRGGSGYRGKGGNGSFKGGRSGGYRGKSSDGDSSYRGKSDDRRGGRGGFSKDGDDRKGGYRGKGGSGGQKGGYRGNGGKSGGYRGNGDSHSDEKREPKRDFRHRNTTRDPRRKFDDKKKFGNDAKSGVKADGKFGARSDAKDAGKRYVKPRLHKSKATPARLAALEVVRQVRERNAFAQEVISQIIDKSRMSVEDRAFATLLALGTVSARGTLDEVIDRALDEPTDVFRETRDALQISTYELLFLGKEPHVAVDQGVEMVKSFSPGAAVRVANAVLHKIVRLRLEFPFGNPAEDIDALARTQAFPSWIAAKLIREMGAQAAVDFMRASNEQAPLYVAVNACKTDDESVLKAFERAEEEVTPMNLGTGEVPGCMRVPESRALLVPGIARQIEQGKMLVSDAASQLVAASVLPEKKPDSVLEIGAGRATKTILLQSNAMRKFGSQIEDYVTLDNHEFKTKILQKRVEQYGVCVSEAMTGNALELDQILPDRLFDFIFIDAPCSGLGTLRRHPEIRWRLEESDLAGFTRTQIGMLKAAAAHVAVGGTLAYATCTVTREENAGVVSEFLSSDESKGFKVVPIDGRNCIATRLAPGASDAHFAVKFVREA